MSHDDKTGNRNRSLAGKFYKAIALWDYAPNALEIMRSQRSLWRDPDSFHGLWNVFFCSLLLHAGHLVYLFLLFMNFPCIILYIRLVWLVLSFASERQLLILVLNLHWCKRTMYTYATAVKQYYWQEALFCLWNKVALTKNYIDQTREIGLNQANHNSGKRNLDILKRHIRTFHHAKWQLACRAGVNLASGC